MKKNAEEGELYLVERTRDMPVDESEFKEAANIWVGSPYKLSSGRWKDLRLMIIIRLHEDNIQLNEERQLETKI